MWLWSRRSGQREEGRGQRGRRAREGGTERGRRKGGKEPNNCSKGVQCGGVKEVVTVSRHIVEVSQYRTFSIFFYGALAFLWRASMRAAFV